MQPHTLMEMPVWLVHLIKCSIPRQKFVNIVQVADNLILVLESAIVQTINSGMEMHAYNAIIQNTSI